MDLSALPLAWVLGKLTFDMENELQIQKFKLLWKVDLKIFPTCYFGPNLDIGKALKRTLEDEGCTWHCVFDNLSIFSLFHPSFHFHLGKS